MTGEQPDQVWEQRVEGRLHRVEATGSTRHRVRWLVDGTEVATLTSLDERLRLRAPDGERLEVRFSTLGSPRRATVRDVDLTPVPGSPAAAHEQRVRDHPGRYAALAAVAGVARVVVPIVGAALLVVLARWLLPLLPDLPAIPRPDLPDLPSVPLPDAPDLPDPPDLPDLRLPGWVRWALDHASYVVPVVVAVALARAEVRRRRTQDERRRRQDHRPSD